MRKVGFWFLILASFAFASDTNVLSSNSGRYVYGQLSSMRADQYLLDTKTGRLWNMVADKDGNTKLQPVLIENVNYKEGKYSPLFLDAPIDR